MPQDPDLYGRRAAKKQKRDMGLADTLDFASQLQSLIQKPVSSSSKKSFAQARRKDDLAHVRVKRKRPLEETTTGKLTLKETPKTQSELDAAERDRVRRALEAKAKRYAAMQRGDDGGREGEGALVDFDRKWAEGGRPDDDDESENESERSEDQRSEDQKKNERSEERKDQTIEYTDEFGRTRTVSRAQHDRLQRQRDRIERADRELADMRARPTTPPESRLLRGDVIQTQAIEVTTDPSSSSQRGEAEETKDDHYDASTDVRTRGAAFYQFATRDETLRREQMEALAKARQETEKTRAERATAEEQQLTAKQQAVAERKAALEERRRQLAEKRAEKQADRFLDGLGDLLKG